MADDDKINWNVDLEVGLFHAIHAHRPVGINRHFQMVFLHDKFNGALDRKISAKEIWTHLMEMYDLNALNESDGLPFPNTECEFSITDAVTADLIDKPFPRSSLSEDTKSGSESTKRKEATKDVTGAAVESAAVKESVDAAVVPSRSAKMSAVETVAIESSKAASAADSPKIDNRKRTRQSLQSPIPEAFPATATSTPSSGKRSRRI